VVASIKLAVSLDLSQRTSLGPDYGNARPTVRLIG
jgi:hypothetical protein